MSINLSIRFEHPDAVSQSVRYARVDNTSTPTYSTVVPNPVTSPTTIATNIDNGQYRICSTPVYADGRTCEETCILTDACPGLISINAYISDSTLVVSYLAPSTVPQVRITVNYPNGGSFVQNYTNTGDDIAIGLPSIDGIYTVSGQSVCDADTGFYSPASSTVSVEKISTNVSITSSAAGVVVTDITGIAGFTLSQFVNPGDSITGIHTAFFNAITVTFTGTPVVDENLTVYVNGTAVACTDIPNTSGGTISISSISVSATDLLSLAFNTGQCP